MAPFLMTALVGIGVKIATDLFMSGVKQIMKPTGAATSADATSSFSSTLDKARAVAGGASPASAAAVKPASLEAGLADRSRILVSDFGAAMPAPNRLQGTETYRRLAANSIEAP